MEKWPSILKDNNGKLVVVYMEGSKELLSSIGLSGILQINKKDSNRLRVIAKNGEAYFSNSEIISLLETPDMLSKLTLKIKI